MRRIGLKRAVLAFGAAWLLSSEGVALADDQVPETVVVTGTRIPRPEYDLPNPVTSIDSSEIQHNGTTNITDYLGRIPALVGSLNDYATNGYGSPASNDGSSLGGLNLLDLRNLGYIRTLVLVDGHRHVAESTGSAAIDINTIPISLIDRVEISTGGASAIYGADGVSGVVNFVMKHDLDGLHASFQAGASQDGGGNTMLGSASYGWNFDDGKGNLTLTEEYSDQTRLNFAHRSFSKLGGFVAFVPNPADGTGPNDDPNIPDLIPVNNATFIWSAPTGAISSDFFSTFSPDFTGDGQPYVHGNEFDFFDAIGGSGMPYSTDLQGDFLPVEKRQISEVSGNYEFNRFLKITGEFKYAHVDTRSTSTPPFDDFTAIFPDNPFLPGNVRDAILAGFTGFGVLGEDYLQLTRAERVSRDTYRGVLDFSGDVDPENTFVHNLRYDVSYVYGETNVDDVDIGNRIEDRFFAALDAVTDPATGQPTCRSNLDPGATPLDINSFIFGTPGFSDTSPFDPAQYPATFTPGPNSGCVPFNPFTPNADQSASLAFMTRDTHTKGNISQHVITAVVTGEFPQFEDFFAGALSVVIGGEYRFEKSSSIGDPFAQHRGYTFDPAPQNVNGSFSVTEGFAEVSLPVIKDKPFIKELTVDGAIRQSSYSTAGSSTTWKFGGVWAPIDGIRFRGTDAYAVRAPNIGELFAPAQTLFSGVSDPCDRNFVNSGTGFRPANCAAIFAALGLPYDPNTADLNTGADILTIVSGNPHLAPEAARTLTAGVVIQPTDWIPGLNLSADWYRVVIANAITAPGSNDIANECVDLSTINNPFCSLLTRNPTTGRLTQISEQQINVATFETSGVDFTATYHLDPQEMAGEDIGTFDFHLLGNYLNSLSNTALPNEASVQSAGVAGAPKWQSSLDVVWNFGPWNVDYNIDWYSPTLRFSRQTEISQPDRVAPQYMKYPARFVQNLQVGYDFEEGLNVYAGINNLFYQKPDFANTGYPVNPVGRFFYLGAKIDTGR